jgi:Dolichyl-phosphate-mannose-protein mannosyltransferase
MSLLYLALFCLAGLSLVKFLIPGELRASLHNALLVSLGAGVGLGIASSLYFLCIVTVGPKVGVLAAVEGAFVVGACVLGLKAKASGVELRWREGAATPVWVTALLVAAGVLGLVFFVTHSATKPHGEWDAWAIWNLHARFLYRSGELWKNAFSPQISWSHPDYPVLLPGLIALCWTLSGSESTLAPVGVSFIFTFATAGVLISALGVLRGRTQAWIAGALLLGTVEFVEVGAMQYADVPLSFFIVAAVALLCLQDRRPDDLRFTVLAGLMAGFAAWTKNEGLLFVIAVIVARLIAIVRYKAGPALVRQLGAMAAGLVFPLAVVALFKLRLAPPNDLASAGFSAMATHASDVSRWMSVLVAFGTEALFFGQLAVQGVMVRGFLIPISLVLVLYWFLVRFHVEERDRPTVATASIAAALMLVGDFAVYIFLPNDVVWQLNTSLDRIFLQLWPVGLLAFFLATNAPQLAAKREPEKVKPARRTSKPQRRAAETR